MWIGNYTFIAVASAMRTPCPGIWALSLPVHFPHNCSGLLLTVCSQSAHSLLTVCSQSAHSLLTVCSQSAHSLLTVCSQSAHSLLTVCSQSAHSLAHSLLLTVCSQSAHSLAHSLLLTVSCSQLLWTLAQFRWNAAHFSMTSSMTSFLRGLKKLHQDATS